ncbi:ATP-grasp domain-containing protein [[Actinomadura] parvosata]|uniref:ATP-grasp domain-containing protein n=1 Tax=[Actinomadura] parvosata TaxID=1955412 RepID=UPI00406CBD90
MRTLVINRHELSWATGEKGSHLPAKPADRYLITRTFGGGLAGYDAAAFPNVAVVDTVYPARLEATARWLIENHQIQRIISLHEKDLILAARLRESYGLPGTGLAETLRFRDKLLMKDTLAAKGYPGLPRYKALNPGEVLHHVPWQGPIVVKSRWGVGASEVRICDDVPAANRAAREMEGTHDELEIEEYIAGDMYHCDSIVHDGHILFCAISQYVAQPGHFAAGGVAGSVLLLDGDVREDILAENQRVLRLLAIGSGVTHVEFFRTPSGDLVFCEAAARPGGGGISDIILRAYGVDIVHAAVRLQSGLAPDLSRLRQPTRVIGVIGVYHSVRGDDQPVADLREQIPDVQSYTFSPQEMPGRVRHCTDYAHKVVLGADSLTHFNAGVRSVVEAIRKSTSRQD